MPPARFMFGLREGAWGEEMHSAPPSSETAPLTGWGALCPLLYRLQRPYIQATEMNFDQILL